METELIFDCAKIDPTSPDCLFESSTLGHWVNEAFGIVINAHRGTQPKQGAVMVEFKHEVFRDEVSVVHRTALKTLATLE